MELQGRVVAVCSSPQGGIPKYRRLEIEVGMDGVVGDYHAGPYNRHKKRGELEPNTRQLTIVAQEVLDDVNEELGIQLEPGFLGENLTVVGLGDLSDLEPGDLLIAGAVILEVTAQNKPCSTVAVYHPQLVKTLYGRRGVCAIVRRPGIIRPGDPVMVQRRGC
ncbi:MOSC domain-containing protein [Thermomicrobium sp. 4228-Ro]|uniref:MOSC domain-containing protein n=1 Tax=Thermomicrobium sp. 4228-Ro TaxID=2993937 RepID=UPI002249807D|nr:MOSC domain-containing protein [Thermomicrobium sp. 4228-Ro]MCX2726552.1 MOSC domain-containing protein [Thermomicrobium sp. 4228-Ro]